MAAEVCHQAIGTLQFHSFLNNLNHPQKVGNNLVRLVTKDFISTNGLSRSGSSYCGQMNRRSVIRSSASQTSIVDPVSSSPSKSNSSDKPKKSSKIKLSLTI